MALLLANIYNNAAKYAMEHTRIYADLEEDENEVVFSLKNISEQALNISADELTERFIRGDISRSTKEADWGFLSPKIPENGRRFPDLSGRRSL